jgi:hypothetical protein
MTRTDLVVVAHLEAADKILTIVAPAQCTRQPVVDVGKNVKSLSDLPEANPSIVMTVLERLEAQKTEVTLEGPKEVTSQDKKPLTTAGNLSNSIINSTRS